MVTCIRVLGIKECRIVISTLNVVYSTEKIRIALAKVVATKSRIIGWRLLLPCLLLLASLIEALLSVRTSVASDLVVVGSRLLLVAVVLLFH